jgi:hypothetical protein
MAVIEGTGHLSAALRWSPGRDGALVEALAASIAMAAPVAAGAALGHLALGLAAAVGGLVLSDVAPGPTAKAHLRRLATVFAPTGAACVTAMAVAGHGWITDALVVVLAAAMATVGGASRNLAVFAMRFVLALVLIVNATAAAGAHPVGLLVVILAGALATAVISLVLGLLPGSHRRIAVPSADLDAASRATAAQKYARWKRTLAHGAGWQYPARLAGCLVIAGVARNLWPSHHLYWIALVVAILTQRQLEPLPLKITQRALGTMVGVAVTGLFIAYQPAIWGLVVAIGVLAALRPVLKARNYLAYTAIMTPLIVLIMGANHPVTAIVLVDRLAATVAAAALVLLANVVATRWLSPAADRR